MGFLRRMFATFACLIAGWLMANLILVTAVVAFGVSIRDALAWPYETGRVSLVCWVLFGPPLAVFDTGRTWFSKWWLASLCGGTLGAVSFAGYMHWFVRFTPSGFASWFLTVALGAVAFAIGSVTLGLYYGRGGDASDSG